MHARLICTKMWGKRWLRGKSPKGWTWGFRLSWFQSLISLSPPLFLSSSIVLTASNAPRRNLAAMRDSKLLTNPSEKHMMPLVITILDNQIRGPKKRKRRLEGISKRIYPIKKMRIHQVCWWWEICKVGSSVSREWAVSSVRNVMRIVIDF